MRHIFWIVFLFSLWTSDCLWALTKTYFSPTFFPLEVYYLQGELPGPTVMVQGGIQGDEPSGVICAQILTLAKVKKGNLIIVPRANWPSLLLYKRQINVDLNRRFDKDYHQYYEDTLAKAISYLSSISDGLIHLHEGSGFYSPTYINIERNPRRYGQSIIIDTSTYQRLYLASLAENVLSTVNNQLHPPDYAFSLFNMNTFSSNTLYPEQKKSLTYNVLKKYQKPAFAVEVSKNIKDLAWKVQHMLLVVKKLAKEMGVEIDVSGLDVSSLVKTWYNVDVEVQRIEKSRYSFQIAHTYQGLAKSGVVVDGVEYDFRNQEIVLFPGESRKAWLVLDGKRIKEFSFSTSKVNFIQANILVYALDGKIHFALPGETILAKEGQSFIVYGLWPNKEAVINIKGYVGLNVRKNEGQDVDENVYLTRGAFIPRYLKESSDGWKFQIVREDKFQNSLKWTVKVEKRKLKDIFLLKIDNNTIYKLDKKIPSGKYILKTNPEKDVILILDKYPLPYYSGDVLPLDAGKHHLCFRDNYTFQIVREEDIYVSP